MSQSFIIIASGELTMSRIRDVASALSSAFAILKSSITSDRYQISYEADRSETFSLYQWSYPEAAVLDYLEFDGMTPDLADLLLDASRLKMYRGWFTHFAFVNSFLLNLCESSSRAGFRFWIDNDYGALLSSDDVLKAAAENPLADWRFPSAPS